MILHYFKLSFRSIVLRSTRPVCSTVNLLFYVYVIISLKPFQSHPQFSAVNDRAAVCETISFLLTNKCTMQSVDKVSPLYISSTQ